MKFSDILIGMKASVLQQVSSNDVEKFGALSGDLNPIHFDPEYAKSSYFGKRVAHGMLSASFFSRIFGTELPGPGCLYAGQNLRFHKPVFIDDTVLATVEIIDKSEEKRILTFKTECSVQHETVISGTAYIYIPNLIQSDKAQ